ncbi:hypothetical protein ADJ80_10700 [Aggregatibacter aphrophilus]|jgi:hypothetical protein|uniref:Uncharacterized protein n=1 Tax=Aggregatibacter aphrophilus TaxID=732 RepID=A0AAP7GYR2_AGGAP|nr:hypothetical protein ADJ80_10700 [Aggregatibacter aphrophilus]OBY51962.1 hypothetical protein BBB52_06510 [Aggregatibacter aphrophilus]
MTINKLRGEFSLFIEFLQMIIISIFILVWFYISSLSGKRAVFFAECYKNVFVDKFVQWFLRLQYLLQWYC